MIHIKSYFINFKLARSENTIVRFKNRFKTNFESIKSELDQVRKNILTGKTNSKQKKTHVHIFSTEN